MKKFFVEARADNGMRITMTISADTAVGAAFQAGRVLISNGFIYSRISIVKKR